MFNNRAKLETQECLMTGNKASDPPGMTESVRQSSELELAAPTGQQHRPGWIDLSGVRTRNLKSLDIQIPIHGLVVITGVCGAGKSSLAFETIGTESQRRFVETFPTSSRRFLERLERPPADRIGPLPPAIMLRRRLHRPSPRETVATLSGIQSGLQQLFAQLGQLTCPTCGSPVLCTTPREAANWILSLPAGLRLMIGFPASTGQAGRVEERAANWIEAGFQRILAQDQIWELKVPLPSEVAADEWQIIVDRLQTGKLSELRLVEDIELAYQRGMGRCSIFLQSDPGLIFEPARKSDAARINAQDYFHWRITSRLECGQCQQVYEPITDRTFSSTSRSSACPVCHGTGKKTGAPCPACRGHRLNKVGLAVRIQGRNYGEVCQMTVNQAEQWLEGLGLGQEMLQTKFALAGAIHTRLSRLRQLGTGHLSLGKGADELPGHIAHRISVANLTESRLVESIFILEEPLEGLYESEIAVMISALRELVNHRNCVLAVGNSLHLIQAADWIIELGPGSGEAGGQLLSSGSFSSWKGQAESLLAPYLDNRLVSDRTRRQPSDVIAWNYLVPENAAAERPMARHEIQLPLGVLGVVTGHFHSHLPSLLASFASLEISKSEQQPDGLRPPVISPAIEHLGLAATIYVGQYQAHRLSRANVASSAGLWTEIRQVLAETSEAQFRQFTPATFSLHNSSGGRCQACGGLGEQVIDLQFLSDVRVACPECRGAKFQRDVLEVQYRGRNAAELLDLTVLEALNFFRGQSRLQRRLLALKEIGLGYLTLGQPSSSLSNGEAQRLQLSQQMLKHHRGACLLVLEEPSAGLHPRDLQQVVQFFDALLDQGHSFLVFDNSDLLKQIADAVIEFRE